MMKLISAVCATLLMVSAPALAEDNKRLVRICQNNFDGEPRNWILILEQLDTDKYSASEFLKAGQRKTDKIAFSLKILEGDLRHESKSLEQLYGEILERGKLIQLKNHKDETAEVDVEGIAYMHRGSLAFSFLGSGLGLTAINGKKMPDFLVVYVDDHFGLDFRCQDWLKL